jgi:hypothetical protein
MCRFDANLTGLTGKRFEPDSLRCLPTETDCLYNHPWTSIATDTTPSAKGLQTYRIRRTQGE